MEYTVDYFIKKFEAIPECLWISGALTYNEQHCANGHCGVRSFQKTMTAEAIGLQKVFAPLELHYLSTMRFRPSETVIDGIEDFPKGYSLKAAAVNNGESDEYQQPTPKQRILAALYDIKKAQQPEEEIGYPSKERIVYVTVDAPVRELQKKELSMQ